VLLLIGAALTFLMRPDRSIEPAPAGAATLRA